MSQQTFNTAVLWYGFLCVKRESFQKKSLLNFKTTKNLTQNEVKIRKIATANSLTQILALSTQRVVL